MQDDHPSQAREIEQPRIEKAIFATAAGVAKLQALLNRSQGENPIAVLVSLLESVSAAQIKLQEKTDQLLERMDRIEQQISAL